MVPPFPEASDALLVREAPCYRRAPIIRRNLARSPLMEKCGGSARGCVWSVTFLQERAALLSICRVEWGYSLANAFQGGRAA